MLPEEVPDIYSKLILFFSKAFKTPICAAPFTPPPAKQTANFYIKKHPSNYYSLEYFFVRGIFSSVPKIPLQFLRIGQLPHFGFFELHIALP